MVQEIRRIILSKEELVAALAAHSRMAPGFLPQGKVVDYEVIDLSNIKIMLVVGAEEQETTVVLDDSKMLPPLIRFCLENNVVLPRNGRKSIAIAGQSISLCVELEIDILIMHGAAPTSFSELVAAVQYV